MSKQAWTIVAIVVGSAAPLGFCGCGGLLLWFFGRKQIRHDPVPSRGRAKGTKSCWTRRNRRSEIGLVVEKFTAAKESEKEIMNGLVEEAQKAPRL